MHKLSQTLYSNLFWLISALLVWLVIVPVTLIGLPLILVIKAVEQNLFQIYNSEPVEAEKQSPIHPDSPSAKARESFFTLLLLSILIEVPAVFAAIFSCQPTRLITGNPKSTQVIESQQTQSQRELLSQVTELPVQEKMHGD